jgi:hypothetical protein
MVLGDYFLEPIKTRSGDTFRVSPLAADPVSDKAVLGAPDGQEFGKDCDAFDARQDATNPVDVSAATIYASEPFRVEILSHDRGWIDGKLTRYGTHPPQSGCVFLEASKKISGGTSGGPIVDPRGRLMGVVSNISARVHGMVPIVHVAVPRWIWALIGTKHAAKAARKGAK